VPEPTKGAVTEPTEYSFKDAIAELKGRRYEFRHRGRTLAFLTKHRSLMSHLFDAQKLIDRFFPASRITLEVVSDPEIEDYDQLVVYVGTDLPPRRAFETLRELDREWHKCDRRNDKLLIHLEMQ
jgi:hypothetical protein